jgi:hypothetical protein
MNKSDHLRHQALTLRKLLTLAPLLALSSCSSLRQSPQPVREVHTDTIYIQQHSYDSIHLYEQHKQEYRKAVPQAHDTMPPAPDTVIITTTSTAYRYKLLRDTIRLIHTDTIPYKVTVTKTNPIPHIPWWTKALILLLTLLILLLLLLSKR